MSTSNFATELNTAYGPCMQSRAVRWCSARGQRVRCRWLLLRRRPPLRCPPPTSGLPAGLVPLRAEHERRWTRTTSVTVAATQSYRCDGKIRERTFRRPQGADRGRPRSAGCAPGSGWSCMALVCETGTVETWGSSAPALECFVLSTDVLFDFFQFKP